MASKLDAILAAINAQTTQTAARFDSFESRLAALENGRTALVTAPKTARRSKSAPKTEQTARVANPEQARALALALSRVRWFGSAAMGTGHSSTTRRLGRFGSMRPSCSLVAKRASHSRTLLAPRLT
jgi:LDH2 family malate/lactate/ureidoglycolate dehydrogenase